MGMAEFSKWLRRKMEERDISQAELARRSGVSPSQVSKIYNGTSFLSVDACSAIARALELPPELVFRAAVGLSTASGAEKQTTLEWLVDAASPEEQEAAIALLQGMRSRREQAARDKPAAQPPGREPTKPKRKQHEQPRPDEEITRRS